MGVRRRDIGKYAISADGVFACRNLKQLEGFVAKVVEGEKGCWSSWGWREAPITPDGLDHNRQGRGRYHGAETAWTASRRS